MNAVVTSTARTAGASMIAAGAGLLTRPCCIGPALLSLTGGSVAGLGHVFSSHSYLFAALSMMLLSVSVWLNVRFQTQRWNKWIAAVSTVGSFVLVARGLRN